MAKAQVQPKPIREAWFDFKLRRLVYLLPGAVRAYSFEEALAFLPQDAEPMIEELRQRMLNKMDAEAAINLICETW